MKKALWHWRAAGVILLLGAWEFASRLMGSALLLPGPLPVFVSLIRLASSPEFAQALGWSFLRVIAGLALAIPLAVGAGIASGLDRRIAAFLSPLFAVLSATPVMSIILIAFLALGSEKTPVFTAFLVIFPVITYNTMQGVRSVERELREMAAVFRLDTKEKLAFIYLPHILPFIAGGIRSACSLGWKAVIAAEVLVQPFRALGAGMQRAKVQLETAELFAWTCAVIAASSLTGGLFWLAGKIAGRPAGKANLRTKSKDNIALHKWHGSAKNKGTANTPAG